MLTKPGSGKETRHFVVSIAGSGLHYNAGDSLGVFPSNRPNEVNELLGRLGATGQELVSPGCSSWRHPITLREALTSRLALSDRRRRSLRRWLQKRPMRTRKRTCGTFGARVEGSAHWFLHEREFVDLLAEFPSARLTPQEFVDHLRKLMPRLYSIASSPRVHPSDVHLTVAIVRYETNHRERVGRLLHVSVGSGASRDDANCRCSFRIRISVRLRIRREDCDHGRPGNGHRAVSRLCAGPGRDRQRRGVTGSSLATKSSDGFSVRGGVAAVARPRAQLTRLDTAFSRDQLLKIYVQDRMRENAAELWAWLKGGAHFYVCGDAKRMAKDVDSALHDIIAQQGGMAAAAGGGVREADEEGEAVPARRVLN